VLVSGENYPDALCSAPLAYKLNAPILLTDKNTLDGRTEKELIRLHVKNVYVIGGPAVVSESIITKLKNMNINCIRLSGSDRYGTAVEVAKFMQSNFGASKEVIAVNGEDYADALSVSSIAAAKGMPVILAYPKYVQSVMDTLKGYIGAAGITKTYVVGGSDVIENEVANAFPNIERIYGDNKYERNVAVMVRFNSSINFKSLYLATGEDFPDALAGSVLAAKTASPIILVNNESAGMINYYSSQLQQIEHVSILGGEGAISSDLINQALNN
jgi:putative cell wall-binding protein